MHDDPQHPIFELCKALLIILLFSLKVLNHFEWLTYTARLAIGLYRSNPPYWIVNVWYVTIWKLFGSELESSTTSWYRWVSWLWLLACVGLHAHHLRIICPLTCLNSIWVIDKPRLTQETFMGLLRSLNLSFEPCKLLTGASITRLWLTSIAINCISVSFWIHNAQLRF